LAAKVKQFKKIAPVETVVVIAMTVDVTAEGMIVEVIVDAVSDVVVSALREVEIVVVSADQWTVTHVVTKSQPV
jgi:hypothetical protein